MFRRVLARSRSSEERGAPAFTCLIMAKPGAGKGTIAKKLLSEFPGFLHLSTGDLLRAHVHRGSTIGKQVKSIISGGLLVPDNLILEMILARVVEKAPAWLLLDGYPRTVYQAIALEQHLRVRV